jgi:hypothetical protein
MMGLKVKDYSLRDAPEDGERTWTTAQLGEDFEVHSFLAPFVLVTRKADGAKGTLEFTHNPRVYFDFQRSDR